MQNYTTTTNNNNKYKKKRQAKFSKATDIPIIVDDLDITNNSNPQTIIEHAPNLVKPNWIRVKAPNAKALELKQLLRSYNLHSVCEEASCPNLGECFANQTATFMILGDICTRRCTFCDVAYGKPKPVDPHEPENLAQALSKMGLKYVVITSVDRDDLKDGGACHFAACIHAVRTYCPDTKVEILVPDFKNKIPLALNNLSLALPDVFNHNIETVPRLYKSVRPGSNYVGSLQLIHNFKQRFPKILTKSGIMLGLGETDDEVKQVLLELRNHNCELLTIGQYLQPSKFHAQVLRYVTLEKFKELEAFGYSIGFKNVASGPLVRSSYHAEQQVNHNNNLL